MEKSGGILKLDEIARLLEPPLKVRYLAFGLVFAWSVIVFETPYVANRPASFSGASSALWFASTFVTPAVLLACLIIGRKKDLSRFAWLYAVAPCGACVGTACIAFAAYAPDSLALIVSGLGVLCLGAAPPVMILLWMESLCGLGLERLEIAIPASFSMTIASVLTVSFLPWGTAVLVSAFLPILSGFCLVLARSTDARQRPDGCVEDFCRGQSPAFLDLLRSLVVIFVAYAVSSAASVIMEPEAGVDALVISVGCVFAIGIALAVVFFSVRIDLDALYRWVVVPFAIAVVLAAAGVGNIVARVLLAAMTTGLEVVLLLWCVRWAMGSGRTIAWCVGWGEFAAYAGVCAGSCAQALLGTLVQVGGCSPQTVALGLLALFMCSVPLLPRGDGIFRCVSAASAPTDSGGDPAANGAANDRRVLACRAVAEDHALSPRESEVLAYLAQGRSQPYIRDVLVLSKNTVSSHVRHIYSKTNVHSKQELIDLVEGYMGKSEE